jgi:ATP-dependent Lon protease
MPLVGGHAMARSAMAARDTSGPDTSAHDCALPAGLAALAAAMPWGAAVIDHVARQQRIQLAIGRPWVRIEPLLLVGPPGVGKTWLIRRLGEALGVPTAVLELGGASDDRLLAGTARGWANAQPAWPLIELARLRVANPILVLDEIDKAGGSGRNGQPHLTLLSMLDRASSSAWPDSCLLTECDLSHISWIACANRAEPLPGPLLSRFHIVQLSPPSTDHLDAALASIRHEVARDWQLSPDALPTLPPAAITALRRHLARTRSIRDLDRATRAIFGALLAEQGGPERQ